MSVNFLSLGILMSLLFFTGQWLGVAGLGRVNRNMTWWCMLAGTSLATLGTIGSHAVAAMMTASHNPSVMSGSIFPIFRVASGLTQLGSLLFTIGFAIHGQQALRAGQRIAELESIATAQSEELHRLRSNQ